MTLNLSMNSGRIDGDISYITNKTSNLTVKNIYRKLPTLKKSPANKLNFDSLTKSKILPTFESM